jgi:hypothetical protein
MQAPEETLRRLTHALKLCFNRSTDRAKGIVALTAEDYLSIHRPWELEGDEAQVADESAQNAFDDELGRAREALTWRALVVAHRVGRAMWDYAIANGEEFVDPWIDWRRSAGNEPAIHFVHSLADEEFFCLRVAYHVNMALNLGQHSPRIPTDGDLNDIAPYLRTEDAPTWPQWFEILGEPLKGIRYNHLLQLAGAAARRDIGSEAGVKGSSEIGQRWSDLVDKVDSVAAVQLPTIDYLERISAAVDGLGAQSRFKVEEALKSVLGERVYSSLCDNAKTALLDAERRYFDRETIDWNSVAAGFAKAFEIQLMQRSLPRLADYLKNRKIWRFPDGDRLDNGKEITPIINHGRVEPRSTLGAISIALGLKRPELEGFGRESGTDLLVLQKCIYEVNGSRNVAAHATGMSFAEVSSLRGKWLGAESRDGGIFGLLCPESKLAS